MPGQATAPDRLPSGRIASTPNDALRTRPSKSESLDSRLKAPDVAKRHWYPSIPRCVGTLISDHPRAAAAPRQGAAKSTTSQQEGLRDRRVVDPRRRRPGAQERGVSQVTASTEWPAEIPVLEANGSAESDFCAEHSVAAAPTEIEMPLPRRRGLSVTGSSGRSRRTACDEAFGMRGILGGRAAVIGSAQFPRERKREHRHWSGDPSTRPPQHAQRVAAGAQPWRSVFVSLRPRSTRHHQGFRPGIRLPTPRTDRPAW